MLSGRAAGKRKFFKDQDSKDVDCVLTVGGDRNLYPGIRRLFGRDLPMLGINMVTLGYLTEVEVQNVRRGCKTARREGNYTIEERE